MTKTFQLVVVLILDAFAHVRSKLTNIEEQTGIEQVENNPENAKENGQPKRHYMDPGLQQLRGVLFFLTVSNRQDLHFKVQS